MMFTNENRFDVLSILIDGIIDRVSQKTKFWVSSVGSASGNGAIIQSVV